VIFRKLFQGGRADILLEEGVDVLDAGIDIVAAPPGKDQRSITLLSGGERTLTAVGLLFALFRTRPSPVCLLDEVDAALDETNIDRFCSVLEDFLGNSQFLVVTHARRTMSYADTIYGVTMQEHGVSKVLSLSLAEYEESKNGGKSTSSNGDTGRGDATEGDAGPEVTERSRLPDTAPDRRVESVQESDLSAS
jgi:chromosome segregation protein